MGGRISTEFHNVKEKTGNGLRPAHAGSDHYAVVSHSFTDQFLEFLRQRTQAIEAADQLAAEDAEDWGMEADDNLHGDRVEGDVSALQDRGGEQKWKFYRCDPFHVGRSTSMRLHVQAHQTLANIEVEIVRHWPDLALPATRWRLLQVHQSVASSVYLEEDHEAFLVEVNQDLQGDQVPIMFEYQFWSVAQHRFYGILEPRVHSRLVRGFSLMHRDIPGHECFARPCFSNLNGGPLEALAEYNVQEGDYILVSGVDTVHETTQLIGFWAAYADRHDVPLTQAFARHTGLAMRSDHIPEHKGQNNAMILQRNMLLIYHTMFAVTHAAVIKQGTVLVIASSDGHDPQEVHPVRMTEMQWGLRRSFEFPILVEALVDSLMLEHSWAGSFVELHPSVHLLSLPTTLNVLDQVILIRPLLQTTPTGTAPERMLLAEVRVEGTLQEKERYGDTELVVIFVLPRTSKQDILVQLHLDRECREHDCLVSLNERVLPDSRARLTVMDGDVARVLYSIPLQENQSTGKESILQPGSEQPEHAKAPETSSSSRMGQDDDPGPSYVPGTLHHSILYLIWLYQLLGKCGKHVRRILKSKGRWGCPGTYNRRGNGTCQTFPTLHRCLWLRRIFGLLCLTVCTMSGTTTDTVRFGEALHPGPEFWLGTANPSGIPGKERQIADLPEGIWGIAETHLSGVNQKAAIRRIGAAAKERGRELQCVPGAPLPLRARSASAGTWAGVLTMSDWTTRAVSCLWDNGEHNIGRVQVVQSFYGPFGILGATLYGWPKSPSWPNALRDTNTMMDNIVREVGLSRGGPRYIVGDFNHDLELLRGWEVLQRAGWRDAQEIAHELWGQEYQMTYRDSTITDHILISPELVPFVTGFQGWKMFADHLSIGVKLDIPIVRLKQKVWPLPAEIPWDAIQYENWRQAKHDLQPPDIPGIDHQVEQWARSYENSFDGYVDKKIGSLPTPCRGRCQQRKPIEREVDCPLLKPSRPGEVVVRTDFVGRAVHRWFQQLRRLQSMVHATKAGKETADAIEYRISLWRAIRNAKGFDGTFETWWETRPTQLAGLATSFPTEPPPAAFC